MRVLIYGAGVIGSLYAVLLAEAGINVTVYARRKRLQSLLSKGLLYRKKDRILTADAFIVMLGDDADGILARNAVKWLHKKRI